MSKESVIEPVDMILCPMPHLDYCVYERCNFWDEARQECSGLCFGDANSLEETASPDPKAARLRFHAGLKHYDAAGIFAKINGKMRPFWGVFSPSYAC
jgi:hypothetical protein